MSSTSATLASPSAEKLVELMKKPGPGAETEFVRLFPEYTA